MANTDSESVEIDGGVINGETANDMHHFLNHNADIGHESLQNPSLAIEIEKMLEKAEGPLTLECCIYRVPHGMRKVNEEAYTPKVVSIGPFHHGNDRLQTMERHKLRYFQKFLERADTTMEHIINIVEMWEPSVRLFYSETIDLSKDELVKLILIDAGFIIELFWRRYFNEWTDDDAIVFKPWLLNNLTLDLLLLENQLPFFVMDDLFVLVSASRSQQNDEVFSFATLTFDYFSFFNKHELLPIANTRHFTDLLRTFYLPPIERSPCKEKLQMHVPSATRLDDLGVKFRQSSSQYSIDFTFSGKVLQIPCLKLEDNTEILFRNMLAFEQCDYPYHGYVTNYIVMLNFLINTSKDVDLLVRKGILVNWLGDSETAATLINSLCKNIILEAVTSEFLGLCKELNEFCSDIWHKRKASLKRDYCNTPWKTVASIAGVILLMLSVEQAVCAVLQLKQH